MAPAEPENDAAGASRSLTWRSRRIALLAFDACCWVFALFAAAVLRYELDLHQVEPRNVALIAVFAVVGTLVIGTVLQVYRGRHCIGTVDDAMSVSAATAVSGAGLFVLNLLLAAPLVPRTVPVIATLIALVLAVGARLLVRLSRERRSRPDRHTSRRVIIFGAGTDGQQLVRSMLSDPFSGYLPVALLDDRPDLRRRRVSGVGVRGTHADLAAVAAATRADLLVMAQREVGTDVARTLGRTATEAGLGVKVLPPLTELLRPLVGYAGLPDLDTDLLGRGPIPVALLDDDARLLQRRFDGVPVWHAGTDIETTTAKFEADLLHVVGPPPASIDRSVVDPAAHAGRQVAHIAPVIDILPSAAMEDDLAADSALAGLRPPRIRQRGKRTMDLLLCVLALPLVLSVCLLVAIVLAVAQGEVLYRAQRVGQGGRPFTMLKFATMRSDDGGPRVTRARDPRITPIGRWLRATKLNELPQVFNVIKGDMSIVGPRPEDPRYVAFFTREQSKVLQVRPGLTSLAYLEFGDEQTFIECANPADIEDYYVRELLPEKLRIELQYLQAWSIARDLEIIARTAARLIRISGGSHG